MIEKDENMKQDLTDEELEIYARQIVLKNVGYEGQINLRNARVCIIGMGGLGTQIAPKLVGMGIGYLRMVDRDIVSRSDLHRQDLYDVDSVGLAKVGVAFDKLRKLNPDVELDPVPVSLNTVNAEELIGGVDVVLDGLDSPEPRYIVNRVCNKLGIPYVFGAAIEVLGNVTTIIPGQTICLECFMPGLKEDDLPKCGVVGVHPSILGMITSMQVFEAVRLLVGQKPKLFNKLLYIDLEDLKFHTINLSPVENCPVCGASPTDLPEPIEDKFFEETCARDGQRNFVVSPRGSVELNQDQLRTIIIEKGYQIRKTGAFGIAFEQSDGISTSILKSGVMIVQASPKLDDNLKDDVLETYRAILIDGMGLPAAIISDV